MILNYTKHESSGVEQPSAIDDFSSATKVYIRKNFEQVEKTDEHGDGETRLSWVYDEAQLSPEEYSMYLTEQNAAKIEYLAMMNDVDFEEEML